MVGLPAAGCLGASTDQAVSAKRINVIIRADLLGETDVYARQCGVSRSRLISDALTSYLAGECDGNELLVDDSARLADVLARAKEGIRHVERLVSYVNDKRYPAEDPIH